MKDITVNENIQKINVMLISCNSSLKMPQDSVFPVQHSAVFIIYSDSINLFGGGQTKFRDLKSNIQSQRKMSRESTNSQAVSHPEPQRKKLNCSAGRGKWVFLMGIF